MNPARWHEIENLYDAALAQDPDRRAEFVRAACAGDPGLLREVESLLADESRPASFLEAPAMEVAARLLARDPGLPAASFAVGDLAAGRLRILGLLGRGGMGEVYEAEDTLLRERVALKTLRPEIAADADGLIRFRHEIQLARRVTHPNVCRIFDLGMHQGKAAAPITFLTMELLRGETLASRLARSGPLAPEEALPLARQMAAGLEAAHRCGVIHRDFKSSNVMLVPGREESLRAVITDFGLARSPDRRWASASQSRSGRLLGTLDYMAPEQLENGESSFRSDIYSLGLVLFEMVTGKLPFPSQSPIGSALRRVRDTPPSPSSLRPELSRTWDRVIGRCLERDPAERFASAAEVARTLEGDSAKPAAPPLPQPRLRAWPWLAAMAGLAVLAAGSALRLPTAKVEAPSLWNSVPLTSYPGAQFQPAFSPDGELVAFAWDGEKRNNVDIYVQQIASGTLTRLTSDAAPDVSPAWSPDGRLIAFRRVLPEGTSQIIVKSYLGGAERKLIEWPFTGDEHTRFIPFGRELCWAPDGKWLVATGKTAAPEPSSLFAVSVETGERRRLMSPPAASAGDSEPALSPDGRWLAFVRATHPARNELYVVAVNEHLMPAGKPRQMTFDNRMASNPAWAADGQAIIFSSDRYRHHTPTLWMVAVSGSTGGQRPREPERVALAEERAEDAAISRRGRRLAFTKVLADLNIWEVHLPAKPGRSAGAARLIASTCRDVMPDFSPDGRRIVFWSDRSAGHQLWICERDGSNLVPLTSLGSDARWSPDGNQIVFWARREDKSDIYVISAQGGVPRRLTHCPGDCTIPSWSRDGKWIYFSSPQQGKWQVWKLPVDDGNAVQVTKGGGFAAVESVDRQYLYYTKSRGLYSSLWRVPLRGGAETQVLPAITFARNFAVTGQGIYFIPWTGRAGSIVMPEGQRTAVIQFFSFATGTVKTILTTAGPVYVGLAVSPDERSLLYTQIDRAESELRLVEKFR